jgi:hypothetical protein
LTMCRRTPSLRWLRGDSVVTTTERRRPPELFRERRDKGQLRPVLRCVSVRDEKR